MWLRAAASADLGVVGIARQAVVVVTRYALLTDRRSHRLDKAGRHVACARSILDPSLDGVGILRAGKHAASRRASRAGRAVRVEKRRVWRRIDAVLVAAAIAFLTGRMACAAVAASVGVAAIRAL